MGKRSRLSAEGVATEDYVRVKARRGEATDSHSLAERVYIAIYSFFFYINLFVSGFTILIIGCGFPGKKSANPNENETLAITCSWMR